MALQLFAETFVVFQESVDCVEEIKKIVDLPNFKPSDIDALVEKLKLNDVKVAQGLSSMTHMLDGVYFPISRAIELYKMTWLTLEEFTVHFDFIIHLDYGDYHDRQLMKALFQLLSHPPFKVKKMFEDKDIFVCLQLEPLLTPFIQLLSLISGKHYDDDKSRSDKMLFRTLIDDIANLIYKTGEATYTASDFETKTGLQWKHLAPPALTAQLMEVIGLVNEPTISSDISRIDTPDSTDVSSSSSFTNI